MQEHMSTFNGKTVKHQYPMTYVGRLFQGSQLNLPALTKEA